MAMHGSTHHDFAGADFVKKDVFFKRAKNKKKAPVAQARVSKAAARPKSGMPPQKLAGGLHGVKIMIGQLPASIGDIPIELPFNVGDEIVRFADVHVVAHLTRARARSRMPVKSAAVSGVAGLSAASSNQASRSDVTAKGLACWSRTERRTSLTR